MDEVLNEFVAETEESLVRLDRELLRLERNPGDRALLDQVFRHVHSLKGTCGFFGLRRIGLLAHGCEMVLGRIREGKIPVTAESISLLLEALDAVKPILTALRETAGEPEGDDEPLLARLQELAPDRRARGSRILPTVSEPEPTASTSTVRVPVTVLEELRVTAAELVAVRDELAALRDVRGDQELDRAVGRLSQVAAGLFRGMARARLAPVGQAWVVLPRLVRDLALDLGKKIELQLQGGEIELDRQALGPIRDALVHLLRNAADHGIERPAERRARGKPETGTITVTARRAADRIEIAVADDGHGLDTRGIRQKVLERGLAPVLAELSDDRVQSFIFEPGLSTADQVTGISGWGVGMDAVRANASKLGGTVRMESRPGQGSVFTLEIPAAG